MVSIMNFDDEDDIMNVNTFSFYNPPPRPERHSTHTQRRPAVLPDTVTSRAVAAGLHQRADTLTAQAEKLAVARILIEMSEGNLNID